jgi:type IV pilus assembly protein PilV
MIEVLVALVITLLGLFALLGVNMRAYRAESESYQRSQAVVLADDMAQRIKTNRSAIASYALSAASAVGTGAVQACNQATQAGRDICEWGNLLKGATEVEGGNRVGAIADARGCLLALPAATAASAVNVVVVWRGTSPSATDAAAPCVPAGYTTTDGLMRYTSTVVGFGALKP